MTAPQEPDLASVASLLEDAVRELRNFAGSSTGGLASLREVEAECDSTGQEPEEHQIMTPPTGTETLPASPTATLPALMKRREIAELLRIDLRTLGRWRADPSVGFPEPIHRARVLRWRRTAIERWLYAREL